MVNMEKTELMEETLKEDITDTEEYQNIEDPTFNEWKVLNSISYNEKIINKIKNGEVAIVLRTGMVTWYCGYKNKEDFPGKILFVAPKFWKSISMPNEKLKEAIKALGYLNIGDKENAIKQVLHYCQKIPGKLVYDLHNEHYNFNLVFLNSGLIDDYGIMKGHDTVYSRSLYKQKELLIELYDDINYFQNCLKNQHLPKSEEEYKEYKEYSYTHYKNYKGFSAALKRKTKIIQSHEKEAIAYINESEMIQDLLPFKSDIFTLGDYQDIPGICKEYKVEEVLWIIKEEEIFNIDTFIGEKKRFINNSIC